MAVHKYENLSAEIQQAGTLGKLSGAAFGP